MATLEQVRKEALALSQDDREFLAVELALSIQKDPGYDEAWAAELNRRWAAVQSGEEELISIDEFEAEVWGDLDEAEAR
jgi:putative addiction module component (TIGR02574 family)